MGLKYLSLFSGIGAFEKALENLEIAYDLLGYSEISKYAIKSYCAIHNETEEKSLGDITQIDVKSLPKSVDLLTHGSPCFPAGTKVWTDSGLKNIENITLNDSVLTHKNRYKKVNKLYKSQSNNLYKLKVQCSPPIIATANHPFFVKHRYTDYKRTSDTYCKRVFSEPEWVNLEDLQKNDYVGVAVNTKEEYPEWNGVKDCRKGHIKSINHLNDLFKNLTFWYFVGRYIGDGWITEGYSKKEKKPIYRVTVCCNFKECEEFEKRIGDLFHYSKVKDRTVYKYQFSNKELLLFLKQFGKEAANKLLTKCIFNLPKKELSSFLEGYLDSDGHLDLRYAKYSVSSVSEDLILGLGQIIMKVCNKPFSIYKSVKSETSYIEGRKINQKPQYILSFKSDDSKKLHGFFDNSLFWMPVRKIEKLEIEKAIDVYNIEVEEDHTYTVNSIVVHNCTSFSLAGKNTGGDKGSGTPSSLLWNSVEIIKEVLPKVVIWENVANVLSDKHRHNFEDYLTALEKLGYTNKYQVFNAKDFGVPQNRNRIICVSCLNKDFTFDNISYRNSVVLKDIMDNISLDEKNIWVTRGMQSEGGKSKTGVICVGQCSNKGSQGGKVYSSDGIFPTLCACTQGYAAGYILDKEKPRKLTTSEAFKLMGFTNLDCKKCIDAGVSNTQLYRQAGNSIVVPLLEEVFKLLYLS